MSGKDSIDLLHHAADELRSGTDFDGLRITATKVASLVSLLRRAGDTHDVPLPSEVAVGIDGCNQWAATLAACSPPPWLPSNSALVLGTLLDQVAGELGKATAAASVELLIAAVTGLSDLLSAVRHAAEASRVAPPAELDGMLQGLSAWRLDLTSGMRASSLLDQKHAGDRAPLASDPQSTRAPQASPSTLGRWRSREHPLPQGRHLGGMVEPGSCAAEEPPSQPPAPAHLASSLNPVAALKLAALKRRWP